MQLALGVEYDGAAFSGYQQQDNAHSVQAALQHALSQVANHPVTLRAAGRTDAGVHATGQVVAFHTQSERSPYGWLRGANSLSENAVSVRWVQRVDDDFHPRYSATARRYMYLFYESVGASPLLERRAVHSPALDDAGMHLAAQELLGERDFSSFRAAGCQARGPFRRVDRVSVLRAESLVVLDIQANAFLLHMVRNIAGALWEIGLARRDRAWLRSVLEARDRTLASPTAPPAGLYLVQVIYPSYAFPAPEPPALLRALGGLERFA